MSNDQSDNKPILPSPPPDSDVDETVARLVEKPGSTRIVTNSIDKDKLKSSRNQKKK